MTIELFYLSYSSVESLLCSFYRKKTTTLFVFRATELKNLLLYALIPHLPYFLPKEQLAHLALYVCSIRVSIQNFQYLIKVLRYLDYSWKKMFW